MCADFETEIPGSECITEGRRLVDRRKRVSARRKDHSLQEMIRQLALHRSRIDALEASLKGIMAGFRVALGQSAAKSTANIDSLRRAHDDVSDDPIALNATDLGDQAKSSLSTPFLTERKISDWQWPDRPNNRAEDGATTYSSPKQGDWNVQTRKDIDQLADSIEVDIRDF